MNDHNERVLIDEREDEDALEDEDLNLKEDERENLKYKFKVFDPEIDMDAPVFKVGMGFADVNEVRRALTAYAVRE